MKKWGCVLLMMLLLCPSARAEGTLGGWNTAEETAVTGETRAVFDRALEGLVGVHYEPVAYLGDQVVSGRNHCFLCRATVVYPGARPAYKLVYIHESPDGSARITGITDLDWVPAAGENDARTVRPLPLKVTMDSLAGQTVMARIEAYDPQDNTLTVGLYEPERFAAEDIRNLQPGDTLVSGGVAYPVETVHEQYDYVVVNQGDDIFTDGSVWLMEHQGEYWPEAYEDFTWREIGTAAFPVSDQLAFRDGIDPATGNILGTDALYTAEEFLDIRAKEESGSGLGPGFACNNTYVTFDSQGQMAVIERRYVPWQ